MKILIINGYDRGKYGKLSVRLEKGVNILVKKELEKEK